MRKPVEKKFKGVEIAPPYGVEIAPLKLERCRNCPPYGVEIAPPMV
ncbi:Uncharacterised protein [Moraxella equi]|uniref:Uncharacterized protein n=1 Tax=Moraxella equi TaxID=60442 RepID=A0A378URI0_9GAMM|nr:Uncharacterised protein [Moraxella equi]